MPSTRKNGPSNASTTCHIATVRPIDERDGRTQQAPARASARERTDRRATVRTLR